MATAAENFSRAIKLIRAHQDIESMAVYSRMLKAFETKHGASYDLTSARFKSWQDGRAVPRDDGEVEAFAKLAVMEGYLDREWLVDWLDSISATRSLQDRLEEAYFTWVVDREAGLRENNAFDVRFPNGNVARAIYVSDPLTIHHTLETIGVSLGRPTLVLLGGAGGISDDSALATTIRKINHDVLLPLLGEFDISVIDGATEYGLFKLIGQTRANYRGAFPLIGVAPRLRIATPRDRLPLLDRSPLDPNHTHYILTSGSEWSSASPWIATAARSVANDKPALALLINGGDVAWSDATQCMFEGIPVLILEGSGRTADRMAEALSRLSPSPVAKRLRESGALAKVVLGDLTSLASRLRSFYLTGAL